MRITFAWVNIAFIITTKNNMNSIKIFKSVQQEDNIFMVLTRHKDGSTNKIGQFNNMDSAKNCAFDRIKGIKMVGNITSIVDILIKGKFKNSK